MLLPKSTAFVRPFYVGTTGLTLSVALSKAGAAFGAAAGAVAEISVGWYKLSMTTADTDTEGALAWSITGTGLPDVIGAPVDQVSAPVAINGVVVE